MVSQEMIRLDVVLPSGRSEKLDLEECSTVGELRTLVTELGQIGDSPGNQHLKTRRKSDRIHYRCWCYPLVVCYIAIEHGHRHSGFTH